MSILAKTPRKRIPKNTPWRKKVELNHGRGTAKSRKVRRSNKTGEGTLQALQEELRSITLLEAIADGLVKNLPDNAPIAERQSLLDNHRKIAIQRLDIISRIDFIAHRIEQSQQDRAEAKKRLEDGYVFDGGHIFSSGNALGTYHPAFTLHGFISNQDPILELALSKTPRARYASQYNLAKNGRQTVMGGYEKDILAPYRKKLIGLDAPMIEWNKSMRGIFRVDLDFHFTNISTLVQNINDLGVPTPNLIVMTKPTNNFLAMDSDGGFISDPVEMNDETITSCHAYWILRDSVCFTDNGSKRAKRAYVNTLREMTYRLQPIGADIGGLSNPMRGKNPFSPHMNTFIVHKDPYWLSGRDCVSADNLKSLAGEMGFCPTYMPKHHREFLERANSVSALDPSCSNSFWSILVSKASTIIDVWKQIAVHAPSKSEIAFNNFNDAMVEFHDNLVASIADQKIRQNYEKRQYVNKIINHFWSNHKVNKTTLIPNIDRLSCKDRKSLNGSRTHIELRMGCLKKLIDGANQLQKEMQQDGDERSFISVHDVDKAKLIKITGLSASTCCRRTRLRDVDEIRRGEKPFAVEGKIVDYLWTDENVEKLILDAKKKHKKMMVSQFGKKPSATPAETTVVGTTAKKALAPNTTATTTVLPDAFFRKKGVQKDNQIVSFIDNQNIIENQFGIDGSRVTNEVNSLHASLFNETTTNLSSNTVLPLNKREIRRFRGKTIPAFIPTDAEMKVRPFADGCKEQIDALVKNLRKNGIKPIESDENLTYIRISYGFNVMEFPIEYEFSRKRVYIDSKFEELPVNNMFVFRNQVK